MLQRVFCLEPSTVFPYLMNSVSQRQKVSFRFGRSEGSASPPAILPKQYFVGRGGLKGVLLWKHGLLRAISTNYGLLAPPSCCHFLLLPFPSQPLFLSTKVTPERSKVQGTEGHRRELREEGPHSVAQPRNVASRDGNRTRQGIRLAALGKTC